MKSVVNANINLAETVVKKRILIVEDQFVEAYDLQLILEKADYEVIGISRSVDQALKQVEKEKPDLVFLDIMLKGSLTGIDLAQVLKENHIGFIYVSANSSKSVLDEAKKTEPYGFIVKPFREQDVLTNLEIAFYRQQYSIDSRSRREKQFESEIKELTKSGLKWDAALPLLAKRIQSIISFDYVEVGFVNTKQYANLGVMRKSFDSYQIITPEKLSKIADISSIELNETYKKSAIELSPAIYAGESLIKNFQDAPIKGLIAHNFGIKSYLVYPIALSDDEQFHITFYSRNFKSYSGEDIKQLSVLESSFIEFIKRMCTGSAWKLEHIHKPAVQVQDAKSAAGFEGIVGSSLQMITVFDYIRKVSPSDTSVLVLGESGTGKEKIAKSIHALSPRKDKPLIIVNCGTIPENLAESILFGHEKGSFTGASSRQIGKFELADGGTIFLDEIGEMPFDLQVKLLRVLQEKEIERVGSRSLIKVDVRIIAATNKNLEAEVAAGRFRMDLYYRLHVFPIMVPPLRERSDDIIALANHFLRKYSEKMGRTEPVLSEYALNQITKYGWPGNIRELEHVIQRSILLNEGDTIKDIEFSTFSKMHSENLSESFSIKTYLENERDYILYILKKCNGRVSGAGGAAEVLDIHPSTLNSKIKKLEIKRELN